MNEYDGSTHQLKHWTKELLVYELVCIHRLNKMMKDVDSVFLHIDPLIYRYLVDATTMGSKDILLRPFAYKFDVFSTCSNPRHVLQNYVPQILTLYPLYPLLRYFIIIRFDSLPTCDPYPPPQILHPFRPL